MIFNGSEIKVIVGVRFTKLKLSKEVKKGQSCRTRPEITSIRPSRHRTEKDQNVLLFTKLAMGTILNMIDDIISKDY